MKITKSINIIGARENNLKNINVSIPQNMLTVVHGVSGCGKSSLIYDTLFAEAQRAFFECFGDSLSFDYKIMDKPDVLSIENLLPAVSLSQKYHNRNPRSTLGTLTDLSYQLQTIFRFWGTSEIYEHSEIQKMSFSCNNPISWCPKCKGSGETLTVDYKKLIPNDNKTLSQGAILLFKGNGKSLEHQILKSACDYYNIAMDVPLNELSTEQRKFLLHNTEPIKLDIRYKTNKNRYKTKTVIFRGAITQLEEELKRIHIPSVYKSISKYLSSTFCSACRGYRFNNDVLNVKVCGYHIGEVEAMELDELLLWLEKLSDDLLYDHMRLVFETIKDTIVKKIQWMKNLKVSYLSANRIVPSLSTGELQRIRLANHISGSLTNILYILDEPCKGLHPIDIPMIISAVQKLVEKGNTLVVIEHRKEFIEAADYHIEIGPGAGRQGGEILFSSINTNRRKTNVELPLHISELPNCSNIDVENLVWFKQVSVNNLKNVNFAFPNKGITSICGVSGSGKSTILKKVIKPTLEQQKPVNCCEYFSKNQIKHVVLVDQTPIGITPRSNVATYLGIYDEIRSIFTKCPLSIKRKYEKAHFSLNVNGGRCEKCNGAGVIKIEVDYMPDIYIKCDVCNGHFFKDEILDVKFGSYNIYDVLNLTVDEAIDTFMHQTAIISTLLYMKQIGLSYIKLGQLSMTLSGGEAQRIKLAKAMGGSKSNTIYLLDEPTSGLHDNEIYLLMDILRSLSDYGNIVVAVEHNLNFILKSDYIIDLGTASGNKGGSECIHGRPCDVVRDKNTSLFKVFNRNC